jgi:hypothetical protein
MDIRDVARLTMKVFGLYVAYRGFETIVLLLEENRLHLSSAVSADVITSALFIVLGVIVWFAAGALGRLALRSPAPAESSAGRATPLDVHAIAFSVLGLYLIANGLVQIFTAVSLLVNAAQTRGPGAFAVQNTFGRQGINDLVTAAADFVVGGLLIFGARSIALRVRRVWREGRGMLTAHTIEIVEMGESARARLTAEQLEFFDASGNVVHRVP